ncbi:Bestrophin, RFP-TM, chloride channel-domain-containing protein [Vararia minispora EC-137]|uniref:Bestrophin, RFP-TM, chloride channel-domain-containing protein n=1 Tax=Vararia minispora EC-137 TaxID=1314806 RepID=A0ACB8QWC2_9AGAM|nr:Bestrophin, RFP-TM, chloride channel-domain-containing protein [Vararia minispora EC-137]
MAFRVSAQYSWLPDVFRVKNSIIKRIVGPVLTVTLLSALVAYAWSKGKSVMLTNSVTPLLAVVVGLILVFRTSYDRYWEARKVFGSLESHVRNLARLVWIQVALPPTDAAPSTVKGKTPTSDLTAEQLRQRKVEVLKLALAFVYACKHYVRDEDGIEWDDYVGIIPKAFLRFRNSGGVLRYGAFTDSPAGTGSATPVEIERGPSDNGSTLLASANAATKRVRVKRSIDKLVNARTPLLNPGHQTISFQEASIPLPLIIAHEISRLLFTFRRDGFLETVGPAGANAMNQIVQGMVDQMTAIERIANTPIPKSYSIHLKQCVSLYLFALPFTLIKELGWATIPVVTVVAFTFMGIEGIAEEIENPFGLDEGDLPLDRYCSDLREEVEFMIAKLPEGGVGAYGWDDGEGDD